MQKREGIEPREILEIVDADMLASMEGNTGGVKGQDSRGSTGVCDRGMSTRQRRELGRSYALL